jgi:hypothetical protein
LNSERHALPSLVLDFKLPPASVDIAAIRGKYHEAVGRSVAEQ